MGKVFFAGIFVCVGFVVNGQQLDKGALKGLLERVVKDKAGSFEIGYIAPENGKDVFEVAAGSGPGKVLLKGSNGVSVASALNYYLKEYCHCLITWNGVNMRLPATLPAVSGTVHKVTPYTWRYYLNYCTYQYTMAWWDWDRWQQEIDWMAMNGINLPLALTGEEGIWQKVYKGMGFTDKELDQFYTGPAFFSWLWMGNIDAWGGPLPAHWKDSHVALQKKILSAERALGMKTVLPAFTGHVPPAFKDRFPKARVKKTNWDAGFPDVYILDPSDPMFVEIGKKYIEAQTAAFGTDHFYSADTFNENVPPTSDSSYLDEMSKKVFSSMASADAKAVWVMQGWMFHYNAGFWKPAQIQGLLKAVPDDHMIVLDLYSESHPLWNRTKGPGNAGSGAYYGKPWIWNMLQNFGGNISLWGRMSHAAEDPSAALHDPSSGKMVGIGLTPEGIEQNPALFHLMLENVWQDKPVNVSEWLKKYAYARYGVQDEPVDSAWKVLERTVYRGGLGEGGNESIIVARPTMEKSIDRVLTKLDYDPAELVGAWKLFMSSSDKLRTNDGYQYDLVDITRQVLANYASPLQQKWVRAFTSLDTAAYRRYSREFLDLLDDMDRLLATRKDFLLGRWISSARANGVTPAEKDLYEKNARNLVTLWGDKESILREYSCRQWSGLIRGFYKPRWEMYFGVLDKALAAGVRPDMAEFEKKVKDWEWGWVNSHSEVYSDKPAGDPVAVAKEMYEKYVGLVSNGPVASNDHIFPPAAAARGAIDFDGRGFMVNGKKTFIVSAGLEYARMPRALWKDRLLRLKRAGFNCVEIYTFWNWHEPQEGKFEFEGDHDLDAFLRECEELGLYVIARVGPYYCAEWDNGGYPLWLRFKPGVEVRRDNVAFMGYMDKFFDRLLPIVVKHQIHKGGSVIMVQLENEHNDGWGTAEPNGYFTHMHQKAVSLGVEVPWFFSGLHHASDPAGDAGLLDDGSRPNPWFSTEFWSVWYNGYGSGEAEAKTYERRTWKIIAHGGGGYNYYMAYGGTNFGYTNNDEDAASYDYSAAVGQAGDLRPIYYSFKRAALFARSFERVLADGVDASIAYRSLGVDTACRVTARRSTAGDIVFIDNPSDRSVTVDGVVLQPGELLPIVSRIEMAPGILLKWGPVRILGVNGSTMVVYGEGRMEFEVDGRPVVVRCDGKEREMELASGKGKLKILMMDRAGADRTWFVGDKVVKGVGYAGEIVNGKILAEEPGIGGNVGGVGTVRVGGNVGGVGTGGNDGGFGAGGNVGGGGAGGVGVKLGGWSASPVNVFGGGGVRSERPLQMGSDGDLTPNAWYRTVIRIDATGDYVLQLDGGDRATIFVDGKVAAHCNIHDGEVGLHLTKGKHALAIFTAHDGRDKLAGFVGNMSTVDMKGLTGPVRLIKGNGLRKEVSGWKFLRAAGKGDALPTGGEADWMAYEIGKDVFGQKEGYAWFRAELGAVPAGVSKAMLSFRSVDENATVYVNGVRVAHHEGWNIPFQVDLDRLDTLKGPLVLTILIENYSNEGGIDRPVKLSYLNGVTEVTGWDMRGGILEPSEVKGWVPVGAAGTTGVSVGAAGMKAAGAVDSTGVPTYYKTNFDLAAYGMTGAHPIYRVHTDGLGHGSVWVNGHNLGRYPEKVPAPGLYIPECWLAAGANELVIYDEDGKSPRKVAVLPEAAAGRTIKDINL